MELRVKVWVEEDGKLVLSTWRVALLEAIARTGSLQAAAAELGFPYRRAWGKIREIEANLGVKLIETTRGGVGGGASTLTPVAEEYVRRYRSFYTEALKLLRERFEAAFREV